MTQDGRETRAEQLAATKDAVTATFRPATSISTLQHLESTEVMPTGTPPSMQALPQSQHSPTVQLVGIGGSGAQRILLKRDRPAVVTVRVAAGGRPSSSVDVTWRLGDGRPLDVVTDDDVGQPIGIRYRCVSADVGEDDDGIAAAMRSHDHSLVIGKVTSELDGGLVATATNDVGETSLKIDILTYAGETCSDMSRCTR